jgi:hypothetical protein
MGRSLDFHGVMPGSRTKNGRPHVDRRSVPKLADRLASENEKLPPKSRWGPKGSTDHYTMKQQIYRVLKQEHYRQIAEDIVSRRGQFEPENVATYFR